MIRVVTAAAVCATGCLSTPAYAPETAVSYTDSGSGGIAAGPGFALRFADGAGFHLPDSLTIDGVEVMGQAAPDGCADESELGTLISPTPRISAHGGAPPVMNRLTPVLRGPAVVQVSLAWATSFSCSSARTPGGTATFTVFPDGRIVRHDTLVDTSSADVDGSMCACDARGVPLFTVSTFWTVARDKFRALYTPGQGALPMSGGPVITNLESSCIDGGAFQLALGWHDPKGMSDTRGTTIRGGSTVIAFGRDLFVGESVLASLMWQSSSALAIGHTGCAAAAVRASEHSQPSKLSINGASTLPSFRDGIYGGDGGDGQPGLALATARVVVQGAVSGSFAVWLRFPRTVDTVRATREGASGPWYLPQRVDDRSWIIWFRDGMSAAQQISIEPI